jgi:hypothetical protein
LLQRLASVVRNEGFVEESAIFVETGAKVIITLACTNRYSAPRQKRGSRHKLAAGGGSLPGDYHGNGFYTVRIAQHSERVEFSDTAGYTESLHDFFK